MKSIKSKALFREITIDKVDEESRQIDLAFSSETPVERFFGNEILDHAPESVRLDRMKNGGPLLVGHNPDDHVGVVEDITVDSEARIGRATVRFGRSQRATEIFDDVNDGIRKGVSVGYRIHQMALESRDEDTGVETFRANDWEPFEISLVSIPADSSAHVGVMRAEVEEEREISVSSPTQIIEKVETMSSEIENSEPTISASDVRAAEESAADRAMKAERERVSAIMRVAKKQDAVELGQRFVDDGSAPDEFFRTLLESDAYTAPVQTDNSEIGLTEKESRNFSFLRAVRAQLPGATRKDIEAAAFEREVSEAAAQRYGRTPQGYLIPDDVLKRDLTVGTATAGGHTVETSVDGQNFIEVLRNAMTVEAAGATVLTGLTGDVAIPRQTAAGAVAFVAENSAPSEGAATFDQVSLTPHTAAGYQDYSRKLLLQSSIDIENFVRNDLARSIGVEIDRCCIEGDPSSAAAEPQGILGQSGIGSVAMGTNGAAPTYSMTIELIEQVGQDNALSGNLAFLTNHQVWSSLCTTSVDSGSGRFIVDVNNQDRLNGYPLFLSSNVPADGTKGSGSSLSTLLFGNFADEIVAYWSGVDLLVDPYTGGNAGTTRVIALVDCDSNVRHAQSFASCVDIVT